MNRKQFIESGESFYHITPTRNVENILANGLKNGNGRGICVVRTNNINVIKYLVETMLIGEGDRHFSIIQITPQQHNILPEEILNDGVVELTNPIHNYIARDSLQISSSCIVDSYEHPDWGIPNLNPIEVLIRAEVDLTPLSI